jgi:hypothetical protein
LARDQHCKGETDMADITYARTFQHEDWVDNEDVVQASGEKGFNQKFHAIEGEFDKLATVMSTVDSEIKKIQRLNFVNAQAPINLAANTASAEFPVETYDRSTLPPNVEKAYFVVILPTSPPPTPILHTFLYRQVPGNRIAVSVQFFNPITSTVSFAFRVLTLATQA